MRFSVGTFFLSFRWHKSFLFFTSNRHPQPPLGFCHSRLNFVAAVTSRPLEAPQQRQKVNEKKTESWKTVNCPFSLTSSYTTINVYEYLINMLSEVMLFLRNYALRRSINPMTCPALARTQIQPEKWTCTRIVYGHDRQFSTSGLKKARNLLLFIISKGERLLIEIE